MPNEVVRVQQSAVDPSELRFVSAVGSLVASTSH